MQAYRNPILYPKVGNKAASAGAIDRSGMGLVHYDVSIVVRQELLDGLADRHKGRKVAVHAVQTLDDNEDVCCARADVLSLAHKGREDARQRADVVVGKRAAGVRGGAGRAQAVVHRGVDEGIEEDEVVRAGDAREEARVGVEPGRVQERGGRAEERAEALLEPRVRERAAVEQPAAARAEDVGGRLEAREEPRAEVWGGREREVVV